MSRQRWIVVAVVSLAVVAIVWWWGSHAGAKAPRYRTAAVERGAIESMVSATGTVQPVEQVEVGTQVSGTVAKLYADYNTRVHAGQVLCQLETSLFQARVLQNRAGVARAEAAVKDAERSLRRSLELLPEKYVSQADVDAAEATLEKAQADLQQARAQLTAADVDLAHTTISAPIEGVVIARSVDLGQTVAASLQAPKLFVIARDLSQMQVETRIDEADIGVIHAGLPVTFTVDAFPDLTFHGRVQQVRLEPIVEQGVVTYTTVIRTENPELKLRPGMTANVSVLVARRDDVLKVPAAALRFRPPETGRGGPGAERRGATAMGGGGAGPGAGAAAGQSVAEAGTARGGVPGPRGGPAAGGPAGMSAARAGGGADPRGVRGAAGAGGWRGTAGAGMRSAGEMRGTRGGAPGGGAAVESREAQPPADAPDLLPLKPGTIYVLRNGRPMPVPVMAGMTDGTAVQVESDQLRPGDLVVTGLEISTSGTNLRPPPGMGGPMFGGPRGGGRPGGGR